MKQIIFLVLILPLLLLPYANPMTAAQSQRDPFRYVTWSPDGNFLALSIGEEAVEVQDLNHQTIARFDLERGDTIVKPIWSPSNDAIALEVRLQGSSQRLAIWYFATNTLIEAGGDDLFGYVEDDPTWSNV